MLGCQNDGDDQDTTQHHLMDSFVDCFLKCLVSLEVPICDTYHHAIPRLLTSPCPGLNLSGLEDWGKEM